LLYLLFRFVRTAGGWLPPGLLAGLIWPWALARAAVDVLLRGRRPPESLPPAPGRSAGLRAALAERLAFRLTPLVGFWADRSLSPEWAARYRITGLEHVTTHIGQRPVILASLHYGALIMVPSLLCRHGVPAALAVGPENWPLSRLRQWRLDLAGIGDVPTAVPADARPMLRFLRPGRCLVVALDVPMPEPVEVPVEDGVLRLATPPLRLARMRDAVVVPVLARHEGTWRISVTFGQPVPDELIRAGDHQAAAAHIAGQLLPLAAEAPGQALPTLVEAFSVAQPVASATAPAVLPAEMAAEP
jgi:hypothetical protein